MPRILAVDDEPTVLRMLRMILEIEGYEVHTAGDADEALDMIGTTRPDLLLLDVMMPGRSGFDLAEDLRAEGATRDLPVIFVTALAETQEQWRGWQLGAVSYVTKPFDTEALLETIARVLDNRDALRNRGASEPQVEHLVVIPERS